MGSSLRRRRRASTTIAPAMTAVVARELIELAHELVRAVQVHDTARLEELVADEFTL